MKNEQHESKIDYGIILSLLLLALISISTMYATTRIIANTSLKPTIMHIVWYIVGAVAIIFVMQFDSEQLWKLAPAGYWLGNILLLLVLFLYDRNLYATAGARSWFRFGPVTFQPSEVAKISYILMLARTVTKHNSEYHEHTNHSDFLLLGKIALISFPPIFLIFIQTDLGTSLVFIAIMVGVILVSGVRWQILLPVFLAGMTLAGLLLYFVVYNREALLKLGFRPYQFKRVDSWLDPYHDASNASFQLMQAMKAIGSGRVVGKGFGVSEVYVPVRESDMIFSTFAENFGFVGGSILIFLYFMLTYQMVSVVFHTKNEFYAYIATGVIMMIVFHVLENIGMNIGMLPLTGIPLPFVSQGGSSLLANMLGIGLVMSMRYHYRSYLFSGEGEDFH